MSIQVLIDDSLLNIFYHCRPIPFDEHWADYTISHIKDRDTERWWHRLAQVCRKWRFLVLASASRLDLCLVCTYGTPVVDMLAHSPPFPLAIHYVDGGRKITPEDEEGILFALQRRRRIRRIRLCIPTPDLQKVILAIDGEFKMLEHLYIKSLADDKSMMLPETFRAPNLRHLVLRNVSRSHDSSLQVHDPTNPTVFVQPAERSGLCARCSGPRLWRFLKAFIHVLDDDSLLNIFDLCRPALLDEYETDNTRILQGGDWGRECWWYKLTQVCRRWRYLILGSASHLRLCLRCTYGTPVSDMLEHSPPLPIIIDYIDKYRYITTEDEEGILFALRHHHRVLRIRLAISVPNLHKSIEALDKEYPILEFLCIDPVIYHDVGVILPETFQAPHLRHLVLLNFALPIKSILLSTAVGLITLSLDYIPLSAYFLLNDLLQCISLMSRLQTLGICFNSPVPDHSVERELVGMRNMTHVTLPNLRWFGFYGSIAYLEALVPRITTPLLEKLQIYIFNQPTISLPNLQNFMSRAVNLSFTSAWLRFDEMGLFFSAYPRGESVLWSLDMSIICLHHDWQVYLASQIFNVLGPVFSEVVNLTITYREHVFSSEWHNESDRAQWREILRPFNNVETLFIPEGLVKELSGSLQLNNGESPLELVPKLKELQYRASISGDTGDAFMSFLEARRIAGYPFTLVRHPTAFEQEPLWDPLQAQPSGEYYISPPSIVDENGGPADDFSQGPQPLPATTTLESTVTGVDGAEE